MARKKQWLLILLTEFFGFCSLPSDAIGKGTWLVSMYSSSLCSVGGYGGTIRNYKSNLLYLCYNFSSIYFATWNLGWKIRLNIAIEKGQNAMIVTTQSTNARYILKVLMVALCKAQRLDIDIICLPNKFELWICNHE